MNRPRNIINGIFIFTLSLVFLVAILAKAESENPSASPKSLMERVGDHWEARKRRFATKLDNIRRDRAAFQAQIDFKSRIAHGPFTSSREFLDYFDFRNYFPLPNYNAYREMDYDEIAKLSRVLEVFFGELRRRVPEFMELYPTAAEVRQILEIPYQLQALSLHNHRPSSRRGWLRDIKKSLRLLRYWDVTTAQDIIATMEYVVKAYLPRIKTVDDYLEFISYSVPEAAEFEGFKRAVIQESIFKGVAVGDANMAWLSTLVFENDHVLRMSPSSGCVDLLLMVRDLVPEKSRSPQTLATSIIQTLTSRHLEVLATEEIEVWMNHPLRKILITHVSGMSPEAIQDSLPTVHQVETTTQQMQRELLTYLQIQSENGFVFTATSEQIDTLEEIAAKLRFTVERPWARPGVQSFQIRKLP